AVRHWPALCQHRRGSPETGSTRIVAADHTVSLRAFAPGSCVRSLKVSHRREVDGSLRLDYRVAAELSQLCLPAPVVVAGAAAGRADQLWRHTCLEVFVAGRGSQGYREFNFSPSGEWAVYDFSAYRAGMTAPALRCQPEMRWQRTAGGL